MLKRLCNICNIKITSKIDDNPAEDPLIAHAIVTSTSGALFQIAPKVMSQ